MIRRILFVVLSALLGIATTVGLAWRACYANRWLSAAYNENPPLPRVVEPVPSGVPGLAYADSAILIECSYAWGTELWNIALYDRQTLPLHFKSEGTLHIPRWVLRLAAPWKIDGTPTAGPCTKGSEILARGWPVVTMWSGAYPTSNAAICNGAFFPARFVPRLAPRDLCILPSAAAHDMPLPLRPIWTPFLASSAIWALGWAGLLWCVVTTPRTVRRLYRRRLGRCTACGYDRKTLPASLPCPECGHADQITAGSREP